MMRYQRRECFTVATVLVVALTSLSCRSGKGPTLFAPTRTQSAATFASISSKRVLEAAMHYPKSAVEPVEEIPMSLTASDGTGLRLTSLRAKAVIQGPLAFTELRLSFHNPEPRVREGRFTITLPPRAAISRFAMKLPDGWQEAEVVERQLARQIYEDFLHRKQDPALLEKKAGNQFRARIFPIPANADKEIIVSFSQRMSGDKTPYRLFLKGLPKMDALEITAFVGEQVVDKAASSLGGISVSHKVVKVNKQDFAPDRDFEVQPQSTIAGLRHKNLALARIQPGISNARADIKGLLMMIDTSASRAAGFYRQVEQVGALVKHLTDSYGPELPFHVACYDQVVGSVYQGPIGKFERRDLDAILARRPLGASDLHRALGWIAKQQRVDRVVLVTDGIVTSGKTDPAALRDAVKALGSKVNRMDVVLMGGIRDEPTMKQLVTETLEQDGLVLDGDGPGKDVARRLAHKTVSGIRISVPGARWIWPKRLDGVQHGDQLLVFADLPGGALPDGKPMTVALTGPVNERQTVKLAEVKRPLLERAWVEARIAHLEQQRGSGDLGPDMAQAIVKQIIKLSTSHRVLSDHTALLVLETEQDYARYGIERTALAEILVVGPSGVEVMQRGRPVMEIPQRPQRPPVQPLPQPLLSRRSAEADSAAERSGPPSAAGADEAPAPADSIVAPIAKRKAAPSLVHRPEPAPAAPAMRPPRAEVAANQQRRVADDDSKVRPDGPPPLTGKLAEIVALIKKEQLEQALVDAVRWRAEQPGDVMALLALGEALQAHGHTLLAARVYGSIIDLFPSRADMRRFAGERLEALGKQGLDLAVDTYQQGVRQRPDHATGHRLLGIALLRQGKLDEALAALEAGLTQPYRINRSGVERILREDLGLVAAALVAREPNRRAEIERRLSKHGASIADRPSLRFVLTWETDANDVDFHILDGKGGHASYRNKNLESGGVLFADVTNGYGPECFAIPQAADAFPYTLRIHYYSKGPMGFGMGKVQILQHDGKGGLAFDDRPFVVMNDRAYVELGSVKGPL